MLLSLNWLNQGLKRPLPTPEKLEEIITAHTAETEGHEETKKRYENVFVGKLKSVEKFSEKLHKGVFDLGHLGDKQIVFGSVHPLVVGQKYPVAVAGAQGANPAVPLLGRPGRKRGRVVVVVWAGRWRRGMGGEEGGGRHRQGARV